MIASLQYGTRCPCGYCHISDVEFHKQEDRMESFFLAETVRILLQYLLIQPSLHIMLYKNSDKVEILLLYWSRHVEN